MSTPVRHVYTHAEITGIVRAVDAATDPHKLMWGVLAAVYNPLLAAAGRGGFDIVAFTTGQIQPAQFCIPAGQWTAIDRAVCARADQWVTRVALALEITMSLPLQDNPRP
ncbi:hypothetical protein GCM10010124_25240 [Pilimelia terevasa]|uniref:Uncharacterized protein n=1 Tax=Pilimelia terevasa TaxID=53372 RepID=A0A8J3FI04_9ACTN|nr:hypothetical protein [Pilimelia terevasa]GGK31433.1 hypothetical protein GCM10010124_25240 [Pilimelia terevasa]